MRKPFVFTLFYILPFPIIIGSLFIGASHQASLWEYLPLALKKITANPLSEKETDYWNTATNIIMNVRLPRVLLTLLIGAALSTSGVVLQAILRNPLVDSYILGISSASAFGASLALVSGSFPIYLSAFALGTISVLITYLVAYQKGSYSIVSVVLSGMIVSGIFTALLSVVQYVANPFKLSAILQWTLGKLNTATWTELKTAAFPIIIGLIIIYILKWRLNILALGEEAAQAIGVNPTRDKVILITVVTLMTATSVATAGIISMYGLFLPHIVRMIAGADHKKIVPGSMFFGGSFLLIIDNFSRSLLTFEIPVGVFTMLLGGIYFIYLMKKNKLNWN